MNIMTYYWASSRIDNRVIARSYKTSGGWVFEEGEMIYNRFDPVTKLHKFFVSRMCRIHKKSELTWEIKNLEKKYGELRIEEVEYR